MERAQRAVSALSLQLLGFCVHGISLYMVTEYCDHMDLLTFLQKEMNPNFLRAVGQDNDELGLASKIYKIK